MDALTPGRWINHGRALPAILAGEDEARTLILGTGQARPVVLGRDGAGGPTVRGVWPDAGTPGENPHLRATRHAARHACHGVFL